MFWKVPGNSGCLPHEPGLCTATKLCGAWEQMAQDGGSASTETPARKVLYFLTISSIGGGLAFLMKGHCQEELPSVYLPSLPENQTVMGCYRHLPRARTNLALKGMLARAAGTA